MAKGSVNVCVIFFVLNSCFSLSLSDWLPTYADALQQGQSAEQDRVWADSLEELKRQRLNDFERTVMEILENFGIDNSALSPRSSLPRPLRELSHTQPQDDAYVRERYASDRQTTNSYLQVRPKEIALFATEGQC